MLSTILANANRNPEETPKPFTVHDFTQWLAAPFEDVRDADEEDEDEADWEDDTEDELPWLEAEPELPAENEEPAWMQWKRNIRVYAEAVAPHTNLPPST